MEEVYYKNMKLYQSILILIVFGLLVYGSSLGNGFVWDDEELIVNNSVVHDIARWRELFAGSTFNPGGGEKLAGLYYKPLMMTAFSALYAVFGSNPAAFHGFQVLIHIGNSILLFLIVQRFCRRQLIPLAASLLFLVHPINTEAVVYAADLQDVLSFFFGAAALLTVLSGGRRWRGVLSGGLLLASLLSKETGIVFAGLTLLAVLLFSRRLLLPFLAAGASSALVYGWLRFSLAGIFFQTHGLTPLSFMSLPERLVHIPAIIFFYLKTLLWPADLTINQQWAITTVTPQNFWLPLAVDIVCLALVAGVGLFFTRRSYIFFLVWFAGGLGLHLQIFPLDLTVSDRWFYTPFAGLLGMGAVAASHIGRVKPERKRVAIGTVAFGLLLIALSFRTFLRIRDWQSGLTLYSRDILRSPDAFDLHNNLGVELFRVGRIDEAKGHFQRSVELSPQWWTNWNNLGAVAEREGDRERALSYYRRAIENGNYYLAYENYAGLLLREGNLGEARQFTERAVRLFPSNARLRLIFAYVSEKLR